MTNAITHKVHLIVDATCLGNRLTGLERYTLEVVKQMIRLNMGCNFKLSVLLSQGSECLFGECEVPNITYYESPVRARIATEQIWIPWMVYVLSPTHGFFPAFPPSPIIYRLRNFKVLKTVYDGAMWRYPATLSWKNKLYMRPLESFGIGHYDVIHTISRFSADEISNFFPSASRKIVNSSIGIDLDSFKIKPVEEELAAVIKKYELPSKFILFVGTIEPRKNLLFLLHAIDELRNSMPKCHLVMAGREGWGIAEVRQLIQSLHLEKHVSMLGSVPDAQLSSLYRLASLFVFPSIYEGFGLPIIEAMASGTPVIASNTSSIPEAAGDAAILLSPHDKSAWVEAITRVLGDANLSAGMSTAGLEQANRFSWRSVADKILASVA